MVWATVRPSERNHGTTPPATVLKRSLGGAFAGVLMRAAVGVGNCGISVRGADSVATCARAGAAATRRLGNITAAGKPSQSRSVARIEAQCTDDTGSASCELREESDAADDRVVHRSAQALEIVQPIPVALEGVDRTFREHVDVGDRFPALVEPCPMNCASCGYHGTDNAGRARRRQ